MGLATIETDIGGCTWVHACLEVRVVGSLESTMFILPILGIGCFCFLKGLYEGDATTMFVGIVLFFILLIFGEKIKKI
jgi:hypothetical protein